MKSIIESILNEGNNWSIDPGKSFGQLPRPVSVHNDVKFILVNTGSQYIKFYTEGLLKSDLEEFEMEDMFDDIIKLKVGEIFDADGGISIYMRVAK